MDNKSILKASSVFGEGEEYRLSVVRHARHGSTMPLHRHEFHELVVILDGRGLHCTDVGDYILESGDVFLIRGEMAHGYSETEAMALVNILFDPEQLRLPLDDLAGLPGYHALFRVEPKLRAVDKFRHRLKLNEEELAEATTLIARIEEELDNRKDGYRFMASAHLMQLLGYLSRCYSKAQFSEHRSLIRLGQVLSFMEQHYAEQIVVSQLAQVAGMSESTLMRTFRKVMGRSPIDHLVRLRVNKAIEMLRDDDVRITDAAFACGFSDGNYFSRQFRRITGSSPREHRKQRMPSS